MVTIFSLEWEYIGVASFNENPQLFPFMFQIFFDQMTTSEACSATNVSQVVELPSTITEDAEMAQTSPRVAVSSGFRSGCMSKTIN